ITTARTTTFGSRIRYAPNRHIGAMPHADMAEHYGQPLQQRGATRAVDLGRFGKPSTIRIGPPVASCSGTSTRRSVSAGERDPRAPHTPAGLAVQHHSDRWRGRSKPQLQPISAGQLGVRALPLPGSSVIGARSFRDGCVRGEDGSYGGFVALEVDEPKGVVKGEHTRRQSENDRRVSAHDGGEIAAI